MYVHSAASLVGTCRSAHLGLAPHRPRPRLVAPLHGGRDAGGEDAVLGQRDVRRHQPQHLRYPAGATHKAFHVIYASAAARPARHSWHSTSCGHDAQLAADVLTRLHTGAGRDSRRHSLHCCSKTAQRTARNAGPWCTRTAWWRCARVALRRPPAASGGTACTVARRHSGKHDTCSIAAHHAIMHQHGGLLANCCTNTIAGDAAARSSKWSGQRSTSAAGCFLHRFTRYRGHRSRPRCKS